MVRFITVRTLPHTVQHLVYSNQVEDEESQANAALGLWGLLAAGIWDHGRARGPRRASQRQAEGLDAGVPGPGEQDNLQLPPGSLKVFLTQGDIGWYTCDAM